MNIKLKKKKIWKIIISRAWKRIKTKKEINAIHILRMGYMFFLVGESFKCKIKTIKFFASSNKLIQK